MQLLSHITSPLQKQLTRWAAGFLSPLLLRKIYKDFTANPEALHLCQQKSWLKILNSMKDTEAFKDFGLNQVNTYEDYIDRVPARLYNDFEPYINRMIAGEKNILTNQEPFHFLLTSGSSGKHAKRIPYNRQMFKNYQRTQAQMGAMIYARTGINPADSYMLNYSSKAHCYNEGHYQFGYVSGLLKQHISPLLRSVNLPSMATIEESDWDKKIARLLEETLAVDLQGVTCVPLYAIKIFEDILAQTGKNQINELWPNLSYFSYGGTSIAPYKDRLNQLVGHEMNYFGIYVASESPLGIARSAFEQTQYYHFLPQVVYSFVTELGDSKCFGIHQLKDGADYYIQIAGAHGLIKYQMDDKIRIHLSSNEIYFEVLGREQDGLNLATEKIPRDTVYDCLKKMESIFATQFDHFFLAPYTSRLSESEGTPKKETAKKGATPGQDDSSRVSPGKRGYHWTLFSPNADQIDSNKLLTQFETELCRLREDYASCRYDDKIIGKPKLTLRSSNTLDTYFRLNEKKGQFKMKYQFTDESTFQQFLEANFDSI